MPENKTLLPEQPEKQTGHNQPAESAPGAATRPVSRSLILLVATAFFMQMMDGSILNTSLPAIAKSIEQSPLRMQSILIAYLLTVAIFIPCSGWLADRFGTRRVFSLALLVFCCGSILCSFSVTLWQLVLARIIQGLGGAIMSPVGRLVILKVVPRADLMRVLGFISIPSLIGPLLGPVLGGVISQHLHWSWIFWVNIPVGLLGLIVAAKRMPDIRAKKTGRFDWAGFFLFAIAMVSISISVEGVSKLNLPWPVNTGLCSLGLLALLLYIRHALRCRFPLFDLKPFRSRAFSVGIAGNFFGRLGSGAIPLLVPLTLQLGLGYSPSKSGLTMVPLTIGAIGIRLALSKVVKFFGFRNLLILNTIVLGLMIASFAAIGMYSSYWLILLHLGLFGVVNSLQFVSMNTATLIDLPVKDSSSGNSILTVSMQLSTSMGVSLGAMILSFFIGNILAESGSNPALLPAFRYTFLCLGFLAVSSALVFQHTPKGLGDNTR